MEGGCGEGGGSEVMSAQPGAREQYDSWIKYPNTYRKPSDSEWVASYDALRVRVKELEIELAKLQDKINPPRAHYERP